MSARSSALWTAGESLAIDRHTIDVVGFPSPLLMERAALACSHEVVALRAGSGLDVVVVCGPGNNGGDGIAVARQLHGWGVPVAFVPLVDPGGPTVAEQRRIARACGVVEIGLADVGERALVVDACLGTGSRGAPRGAIAAALAELRRVAGPRLAVDVPSGVDPDTGVVAEHAIRASVTVTFDRSKPGLHLWPGCEHAGRIVVADIGLVRPAAMHGTWSLFAPSRAAAVVRPAGSIQHKGDRGHVAVRGGGASTPGAAVLAVNAAFRGHAGLVTVVSDAASVRSAVAAAVPEAMFGAVERWRDVPADACVVGPGLTDATDVAAIAASWRDDPRPAVWDASGLDAIAGPCGDVVRVITPHPGEAARMLARLTGEPWSGARVQAERAAAARQLQAATGAVVLLKGRATIIATPDHCTIVPLGGPELATAGSGDVLAGLIGALLGRGCSAFDAAAAGATWHAAAGEVAAARWPGTRALDLVVSLREALDRLEARDDALPATRLA